MESEVVDCGEKRRFTVPEMPKPPIASVAKEPAYPTSRVIVVYMEDIADVCPADRALPVLLNE
jgi:hypothetical protein